jgi:hypothetical protein
MAAQCFSHIHHCAGRIPLDETKYPLGITGPDDATVKAPDDVEDFPTDVRRLK